MKKKTLLKMKDLSKATGVSSGTIRYYVQEGILPKPIKTHRNMAYYDETYVERIRMIKELQKKRYLPLNIIKMLLESRDFSLSGEQKQLFREIERPLFEQEPLGGPSNARAMSREELALHTGLPLKDIQGLETIGMIRTDQDGRFDPESVQLAEAAADLRRSGLSEELDFQVEQLQIHLDLIEFLARKEIELFTKKVAQKGLPPETVSAIARNSIQVLNKLITLLHRRMIRKTLEELA